jgi:hypothetical protein
VPKRTKETIDGLLWEVVVGVEVTGTSPKFVEPGLR